MPNNTLNRSKAIKYFQLAKYNAEKFSKDPSTKVGAIFLSPNSYEQLSTGYNGFPRSIDDNVQQRWKRPDKYKFVEHAERNCIYNSARRGIPLDGSIAIVTLYPCCDCARALIQVGVQTLVTIKTEGAKARWGEDWKISDELFSEAGIKVIVLCEDEIKEDISSKLPFDDPK